MPEKRLVVRPRYKSEREGGAFGGSSVYQVVDGASIIGTHDSREDAARQVLDLGARIALVWERTVIGGRTGPHDFSARLGDIRAGRIYRTSGSEGIGYVWIWNVYATLAGKRRGGSSKGRCEDRIEAAGEVERAFTEWLATPD